MNLVLSGRKILDFLLIVIVTLQSGHALQTIVGQTSYLIYVPAIIALFVLIMNLGKLKLKGSLGLLFLLSLMVFFTAFTELGNGINFYIRFLIILLAAYCIVELYSFESVAECYVKIMTWVSIVALIGYFLVNNTNVLSFLPTMVNINGVEYKVGIIFNYIPVVPDRNCGMFWEPGLFATHLIIATVLEIITKTKKNYFRIIVFSLCIFTANSSAGFLLWFLSVLLLLVHTKSKKLKLFKITLSMIVFVVALFVFLNFDTILTNTSLGENEYFLKLSSDSVSSSSRSQAITHNLEMFASSPIFGAGYTEVTKNMAYVADTSTSTYLMSIFGVLGIIYTLIIIYGIFNLKNTNVFSKIIILAIALIIVNKEPHHQILFTWILVFYLVKGNEKTNLKIEDELEYKLKQVGEV